MCILTRYTTFSKNRLSLMKVFSSITLFFLFLIKAHAFDCDTGLITIEDYLFADGLFTGKVISIKPAEKESNGFGYTEVTFDVENSIKNENDSTQIIYQTPFNTCGIKFEIGKPNIVIAYEYKNKYTIGMCSKCSYYISELNEKYYTDLTDVVNYLKELSRFQGEYKAEFNGIKAEGYLINGKPENEWKIYFKDGKLKSKGRFCSSIPCGEWRYYYESKHIDKYLKDKKSHLTNSQYDLGPILKTIILYVKSKKEKLLEIN